MLQEIQIGLFEEKEKKVFVNLKNIHRGHTVKAVTESFRMAKDSGFKVVSHMMPNLPNVDLERDLSQFKVKLEIKIFKF